jgi:hypothetical protein
MFKMEEWLISTEYKEFIGWSQTANALPAYRHLLEWLPEYKYRLFIKFLDRLKIKPSKEIYDMIVKLKAQIVTKHNGYSQIFPWIMNYDD